MLAALAVAGSAALAADGSLGCPRWSLDWSPRTDASTTVLGQPHAPKRQTSRIARSRCDRDGTVSTLALDHVFRDLDLPAVDGTAAATNGYVHRLMLGWQQSGPDRRLTVGGGLAVSSNALKRPDSLRGSDLRPQLAFSTRWATPASRDTWLGLRIDDRLGALRVLPTVEAHWPLTSTHTLALGFPDSAWRWRLDPRWQSTVSVGPDGGCWQVRDRARTQRTRVCNDAWQAAWRLDWQPAAGWWLGLQGGRRLDADLEYTLDDGRAQRVATPDAWFGAVFLGARF